MTGKLRSARLSDDDLISSVDNGLGAAETAIGTILGIPMDTEISGTVFGGNINSSAELTGLLRFRNLTGIAAGTSFIDDTNDAEFRIVASDDKLGLYKLSPVGQNPERLKWLSDEPTFFNLNDTPVSADDIHGKILAVDIALDTIVAIEPGSGVAFAFTDLTDVADYSTHAGEYLRVIDDGSGNGAGIAYSQITGGVGVENYIELLDTPAVFTNDWQGTVRLADEVPFGDDDEWTARVYHARHYAGTYKQDSPLQTLVAGNHGPRYLTFNTKVRSFLSGQATELVLNGGYQIFFPYDQFADAVYMVSGSISVTGSSIRGNSFLIEATADSGIDGEPIAVWAHGQSKDVNYVGSYKVYNFNFIATVPFDPSGTPSQKSVQMGIKRLNDAMDGDPVTSGTPITVGQTFISICRIK